MTTYTANCHDCGKNIEVFFGKLPFCGECRAKRKGKLTSRCPYCLGRGWLET